MKVFPLLLAFWLVGEPQQQPAQTFDPNQIEDVAIRGNRLVQQPAIRAKIIESRRGTIFNPAAIRRDVLAIYAMESFDDIWVEEEVGPRGGKVLIFNVKEKPKIRRVDYVGLSSVPQSDVLKALSEKKATLSQASNFDRPRVQRAIQVIKALLAEKGRQKAEIEVETETVPGSNEVIVTLTVTEGPKIKIESIDFVGNTAFSDAALKKAMKVVKEAGALTVFTGKDAYHEGKLAYDINNVRTFYAEHGYARVNISQPEVEERPTKIYRTLPFIKPTFPWGIPIPFWTKTVDRLYVSMKVEENDQYRIGKVTVSGSKVLPPATLEFVLAQQGLRDGEIYNETLLRDSFKSLTTEYGKLGFINFVPKPTHEFDEEKKIVNLDITVDEDKQYFVKRIAVSGNTTTRDKVIRREIAQDEAAQFNSALWEYSRNRINQLGYFEEIREEDAKVDPDPTQPEVNVTLKVQEKGRNTIGFNGGVSGIGGSFLGFNYETNNFLGFGETLSLNVQGGTRQSNVVLGFSEPYFLDRPLALGFQFFHSNYKYDQAREIYGLNPDDLPSGLGFENRLNFEQKRDGFSVYGSYPLRAWQRLQLMFQLDNSQTDAVNPATRAYFLGVGTQELASGDNTFGQYRTRRLIPTYTYSTVDNPYFPTRGQSLRGTFEYIGGVLGGNTNFYRPTVEYQFFKRHTRRGNVIALRAMGSHVRGFRGTATPFYERFFPGGDYDIRGFEFRSLGPISFLTRTLDVIDPETGGTVQRPYDDLVYVGGDTQGVFNLEYRIPVVGRTVTLAPFLDVGNAWVTNKKQLERQVVDLDGSIRTEAARFLPGTNSSVRVSTGLEVGVILPVLNAPFRVIMAWNPKRIDQIYYGPTTGSPFALREEKRAIKFTVGKTF
jgi:outer membrane protein insertion porin family